MKRLSLNCKCLVMSYNICGAHEKGHDCIKTEMSKIKNFKIYYLRNQRTPNN